jgi:triosephosphate isomerase
MKLIAANWKMHKGIRETREFLTDFVNRVNVEEKEILICPPFTSLQTASELLEGTGIKLGAQNCYYEKEGAFTGEISIKFLKELGCEYVIVGHSERRHIFGESDELINKKLIACLEEGLRPILCVGEKIEEREAGITFKVIENQVRLALSGIEEFTDRIDIAYEPVWAIGTGVPATPQDAVAVHRFIRDLIKVINPKGEMKFRILYGGSVKPNNVAGFSRHREIEGFLVGGASLEPESFAQIVEVS